MGSVYEGVTCIKWCGPRRGELGACFRSAAFKLTIPSVLPIASLALDRHSVLRLIFVIDHS